MLPVNIYELGSVDESLYTRVVLVSQYNGKWVYCRHKERNTWEIPGGHIEEGESWLEAAKRELYEETGATDAEIEPICVYSISKYGLLCYAKINKLEELPKEYEIKEVAFFDNEPEELTYVEAHKLFFKTVKEKKGL
jgi:8-oxo-dGTP diphosphatase